MFRLNATKVFLTYPQCPLSKEEALQLLQQKHPVEEYCIAQETHEDGGKHLHILLKFSRKVNYKEEDCLDLQTYHPNIQRPRSEKHVHKYCHKEDKEPLCTITQNGQVWRDALSQSTEEGFFKVLREGAPRDYILFHDRIKSFAVNKFTTQTTYEPKFTTFTLPRELEEYNLTTDTTRPTTLVILSPAKYGKTEWARSLGPHTYHMGQLNFDIFVQQCTTAKYAIFDDFYNWDFRYLKPFLGGQGVVTITGKYRSAKQIEWGKPLIILTNEKFWDLWSNDQQNYFKDTTKVVTLQKHLY